MRSYLPDITVLDLLHRADGLRIGCRTCTDTHGYRIWRLVRWREIVTAFPNALGAPLAQVVPKLRCKICGGKDLDIHRDLDQVPEFDLSPSRWKDEGTALWRATIDNRIEAHLTMLRETTKAPPA